MKYKCLNCNYVYDEEKEILGFAGLSEEWICPECGASKSEFELIEEDDFEGGKDILEEIEEDEEDEEDEFEEEDY